MTDSRVFDDRYRLDGTIAEGATSTVYRAWDVRLDRAVAVKVLRPTGALSEEERETFLNDARAVVRLNHPNVVTVLDAGIWEERPYLVMELLPEPNLRQRLRQGALPVDEALRIARRLASALWAGHSLGILHLDVKPENVLFSDSNEPKLADFSISRRFGAAAMGEDGTAVARTAYVAPEQATGHSLDSRADVYGLGLVLYEMLTGRRPSDEPVPPQQLNPLIPSGLSEIVMRALARDPDARFASAPALATALREYQEGAVQHTVAVPVARAPEPAPAAPPVFHEPAMARAAPLRERPRPHAAPPPEQRRGARGALWLVALLIVAGLCTGALITTRLLDGLAGEAGEAGTLPPILDAGTPTLEPVEVVPEPTPTPEPTPAPPTPEPPPEPTPEPPPPAPEPIPEPPPAEPEPLPPEPEVLRLEDPAWQGAYRRGSGNTFYGGRSAAWIYGTNSGYSTMQAVFDLGSPPAPGQAVLRIEGMDSEDEPKTPISIRVNDVEIFNGPNPLPNDQLPIDVGLWGSYDWPFDSALLRPGQNVVSISVLVEGAVGRPPWFMLDYADVIYQPAS
jgi:eukaryotic-like serine/threonine-protein kinase